MRLWWRLWLTVVAFTHHHPQPPPTPPPAPLPPHYSLWERLQRCEAPAGWGTATGNGFHGGLQFTLGTWFSHGGRGLPEFASKIEQMWVAERVLHDQGWGAWPVCSRQAGLR